MDRTKIKAFVQNTLGCGCPEEVFEHIACNSHISREGIELRHRINIGNRLLVYVASIDGSISLQELLPKLLNLGMSERDSAGFNRFRLVLSLNDSGEVGNEAEQLFHRYNKDEKIHLHIISRENIPDF